MADRRSLTGYAWLSIAANMARTVLQLVRRSVHGHRRLEQLERELRGALANRSVLAHLEPFEDQASFADVGLDRALVR